MELDCPLRGSSQSARFDSMDTREHSIATWCKRLQIDLWKLVDRMKAGELTVYEKGADGDVDITPAATVKLKELITEIETALLDE
jgi:hypothetical protein